MLKPGKILLISSIAISYDTIIESESKPAWDMQIKTSHWYCWRFSPRHSLSFRRLGAQVLSWVWTKVQRKSAKRNWSFVKWNVFRIRLDIRIAIMFHHFLSAICFQSAAGNQVIRRRLPANQNTGGVLMACLNKAIECSAKEANQLALSSKLHPSMLWVRMFGLNFLTRNAIANGYERTGAGLMQGEFDQ